MQANPFAIAGMVIIGALTFLLGYFSSRGADATPDFLAARRMVRSRRNAAAISGEYLSAASFLGIAGLVLKDGISALWYPIGFATGYLALLLFIAAPLRRSGAYTVPDFAEARLGSASLRRLCTICVLLIGLLYLVPQLQGAGLTLSTVLPAAPVWLGGAVVTVLVVLNVAAGGMRAVTLVQAFQYWVKLFAIAAPTFVLFAVFLGGPYGIRSADQHTLSAPNPPVFSTARRIDVRTPVEVEVQQPVQLRASGLIDNFHTDGGVIWAPGIPHQLDAGTTLWFDKGSPVPVVMGAPSTNASWLNQPAGDTGALIDDLSLLFALIAGTMGLPHVLVRFYPNPDGRSARRTTVHVLLLIGLFYLFPTILGALSRLYTPELLVTGQTDAAILLLPTTMISGPVGKVVGAVVAAGAFSAFLSTCSGLISGVSGVVSTDLLRGRPHDSRLALSLVALVPLVAAIFLRPTDLALGVGMAFAFAASTFAPVLVLGVWWRGLTWVGAAAGMSVGGLLVLLALGVDVISRYTGDWAPHILLQPALLTVPMAFAVTAVVSRATPDRAPSNVNVLMMRLHTPDKLGLIRDRDIAEFGLADEKLRMMSGKHRRV